MGIWGNNHEIDKLRAELHSLAVTASHAMTDLADKVTKLDQKIVLLGESAGLKWTIGWVPAIKGEEGGRPAPIRPSTLEGPYL